MKLYASTRGGRYHRLPDCSLDGAPFRGIPDTWPTVDSAQARTRHLTPCRTCKPPPLLTVLQGGATTEEW